MRWIIYWLYQLLRQTNSNQANTDRNLPKASGNNCKQKSDPTDDISNYQQKKSKYHSCALVLLKFSKRNSLSLKEYLICLWSIIKHFRHCRKVKRHFKRLASLLCSLSHVTNLVTCIHDSNNIFLSLVPVWCYVAHNKQNYWFYEVALFSCRVCRGIYKTSSKSIEAGCKSGNKIFPVI